MATALDTTPRSPVDRSLLQPTLPAYAPWVVLVGSAVVGAVVAATLGGGVPGAVTVAVLCYLTGIWAASRRVEGGRKASDRLVTGLVATAFGVALLPLVSLVWTVVDNGIGALSATFFTSSMRNIVGEGGGLYHAMWGTLIITGLATLMSVPIGLFTAIYLVEYGTGRLARWITFLVDVMTGIPSIVAGLFAYALFELFFGSGVRLGFGGSVALSVLMIPVVVRATEEMLKLVPNELREAAYALGVPRWRTIVKVVLRTASAGIGTGITIAIARVIGETAPLLIIVGTTDSLNLDPFHGRMESLPIYVYYQFTQPGVTQDGIERAWGAALVLILIVLALNLVARIMSFVFSPKTGR